MVQLPQRETTHRGEALRIHGERGDLDIPALQASLHMLPLHWRWYVNITWLHPPKTPQERPAEKWPVEHSQHTKMWEKIKWLLYQATNFYSVNCLYEEYFLSCISPGEGKAPGKWPLSGDTPDNSRSRKPGKDVATQWGFSGNQRTTQLH